MAWREGGKVCLFDRAQCSQGGQKKRRRRHEDRRRCSHCDEEEGPGDHNYGEEKGHKEEEGTERGQS